MGAGEGFMSRLRDCHFAASGGPEGARVDARPTGQPGPMSPAGVLPGRGRHLTQGGSFHDDSRDRYAPSSRVTRARCLPQLRQLRHGRSPASLPVLRAGLSLRASGREVTGPAGPRALSPVPPRREHPMTDTSRADARPDTPADPPGTSSGLSVIWSDDFAAYATGQLAVGQVTCALCMCAPCRCPAFGTPAYFALIDVRHGRNRAGA
jgi:hypothetical protein